MFCILAARLTIRLTFSLNALTWTRLHTRAQSAIMQLGLISICQQPRLAPGTVLLRMLNRPEFIAHMTIKM